MNTIKILSISYFILFFGSCIRESPKFVLKNESKKIYDSIEVFTSQKFRTVLKKVQPNEIYRGEIPFDPHDKTDGCYKLITYSKNDIINNICFGYYTNGASLDNGFTIIINNKT